MKYFYNPEKNDAIFIIEIILRKAGKNHYQKTPIGRESSKAQKLGIYFLLL